MLGLHDYDTSSAVLGLGKLVSCSWDVGDSRADLMPIDDAESIDVRRLTTHHLLGIELWAARRLFRSCYSAPLAENRASTRRYGPEGVVLRGAGMAWQGMGTVPFFVGIGWFRVATDPPSAQQQATQVITSGGLLCLGVLLMAVALMRYFQANRVKAYLQACPPPPAASSAPLPTSVQAANVSPPSLPPLPPPPRSTIRNGPTES